MFPQPDHDLQLLLDKVDWHFQNEASLPATNPVHGVLRRIAESGNPAALPYMLALVHHPNREVRTSAGHVVTALLPVLRTDQILDLESTLRESWLKFYSDGHEFRAESSAAWMLSTLAGSGWRREKAVNSLTQARELDALPFMLLRLNDWVTQVRKAAEGWFAVCFDAIGVDVLARSLPVFAALGERVHGRTSRYVQASLDRLAAPDAVPELLQILASVRNPRTRHLAFALLSASGALHDPAIQQKLMDHDDPIVSVLLLKNLRSANRDAPDHLVTQALASKRSLVRRYALYNLSERQIESFGSVLSESLFDPVLGIREFAQFHLRKSMDGQALQERYAAALQDPAATNRVLAASLMGFHEVGGRWPAAQYVSWAVHPSVRVRLATLRSFALSHFDEALPWLRMELASNQCPALSKSALAILQKHPLALTLQELRAQLEPGRPSAIRRRALALLCTRGKWEQLPILLGLARDPCDAFRQEAGLRLIAWLRRFNCSQIQPSREQVDQAVAELTQCGAALEPRWVLEFRSLLCAVVPRAES